MAARPRRSHLRVREEEDVVAEARHRLEDVCLKGLCTRQQKRHHSAPGLDVLYFVRGDPQAHASGASRCGRFHFGLQAEDARDEETVPRAPRVQRPAINSEPVRHLSDGQTTKADDPPLVVTVGEALDRKSTRLNSSHGYISYA